jgi:pyruvate/2-oxoglutarate dehydrogenase complex dihydrolipoamide acyltransferase (E2) component
MRPTVLSALAFLACAGGLLRAEDAASIRAADGFQCPVGPNGTGEGYYVARGYRPNGHLGEDWNGTKGGDTDLGDPVYATAHGYVVFAKNYHVGWGNVVIIRHAYYEGFGLKYVDSLYGHLLDFKVQEGDQVRRGQLIGHIGSNNGMYDAHLHFEMRKNLQIGMYRGSFPRDFTNYYTPSEFIAAHRICDRGNRTVMVPINTFPATAPPSYVANKVYTPVYAPGNAPANPAITSAPVLPPARVTAEPAPTLRLSIELPKPTPAPTPAPVVVTKSTPAPAPAATPKSIAVAKSTPSPAPKEKIAATATPAPIAKKEVAEEKPSTPLKTTAQGKTTPAPNTKTTATAKAEATSAAKTTASTKAATATPKPVAITKAATTPAPKTAAVAAGPKGEPAPYSATTKPLPPIVLQVDPIEPPLPVANTPTQGTESPIRRGGGSFRVDRFEDMRGKGY